MFDKITNTWRVMGASWNVLQKNKRLLLFPLLSGICWLLVVASFVVPVLVTGTWHPPKSTATESQQFLYYGIIFLFYFCNYFVIIFFNAATTACAVRSLKGESTTLMDGLREAGNCLHLILGWTLVSATVGLLLKTIENRSEKVGRIVVGLLGVAWSVVSYLVVPILVIERKSPLAALKDSTRLVQNTWGAQVVGGLSFGLLNLLFLLPAFLLIGLGIVAAGTAGSTITLAICFGLAVVWFLVVGLVASVLQNIFRTALYLYTRDGQVAGFTNDMLAGALVPKA